MCAHKDEPHKTKKSLMRMRMTIIQVQLLHVWACLFGQVQISPCANIPSQDIHSLILALKECLRNQLS